MAPLDGACRLVFQLEDGTQIGHVAVVTERDDERGIYAELLTVPGLGSGDGAYWLSHAERGLAWDWLRDVGLKVSYENEETGLLDTYDARVEDTNLETFLVEASFPDLDEPNEWVSLIEDDWQWSDCPGPDKQALQECMDDLEEQRRRQDILQRAESMYEVHATLYTPPPPKVEVVRDPPKRSHHKKQRTSTGGGASGGGGGASGGGGGGGGGGGHAGRKLDAPPMYEKRVLVRS